MSEQLRKSLQESSPSDLRLVLLGNIGCGKTSSADNILGRLSPVSPVSPASSRSCRLRSGFSEGRNVTLVEAPRWYWNGCRMEDGVRKETEQAMTLVEPGPHAVLLLVPVSQFTEMEGHVPAELEDLFGKEVLDHTLVLLTCGDYLMGRTAEEYLQKEHPGLRQVIERCGGKYHVFNNRQQENREQVHELLEKVDNMVQKNGVFYRKTAQERELERRVSERRRELMESFRVQKEEKKQTVSSRSLSNTKTLSGEGEPLSVFERRARRDENDEPEGGVAESRVSNGLHAAPPTEQQAHSEPQEDLQFNRTPSFRLNTDGAILSQIPEAKSTKNVTSTLHHRINSFEDRTPETSPTSSRHPPVSSSFHASETFAACLSPISSSPSSSSPSSSSSTELRLVLLGRSRAGKSAAGNRIIGQEVFESRSDSLTAVTQTCEKKKAVAEGRRVAVVDTPDWFYSEQTPDQVRAEISSCVALSSPGPHAFLLCVPVDQTAKTELQALAALEKVFGPESVQSHTLILFTHADRLKASGKAGDKSVEEYIATQRRDLLRLVEKCGDRFHILGRGEGPEEGKNVAELLEKVEQMVKEAGGRCYSCPAFQEAENRVRQRQLEISRDRWGSGHKPDGDGGRLGPERQLLPQVEEDLGEDEIDEIRDEAETTVSKMNIESLPVVTSSTMSPSLLGSIMEKMESTAKNLPKLLADSSAWVGEGASQMKNSSVWETVGSGAQNVQKMVADSSVWGNMGSTMEGVSKAIGSRVPQVMVDGSSWVGSGAKSMAANPLWEKVGSGAKLVVDGSVCVGAGIGAGAKNLAQSPVWGKVGAGAKTGAKLMADGSVSVGSGIGAGAKKVAQSPVWGKVGSGAKTGAKMVAESPVWEKIGTTAKQIPKLVIVGAVLGLVLGVILGGLVGGAVGGAAGSAVAEVGRRKFSKKNTSEEAGNLARSVDTVMKEGKSMKTD